MLAHDDELIVRVTEAGAGLDRSQPGLTCRRTGDGQRVFPVGLGASPTAAAFRGSPRRHLAGVVPSRHQPLSQVPTMTGGALDADPQDVHLQARQPLLACGQSGVGVVKAGSVDLDPGWVDNRDRHRQLVRIDACDSVLCHAEPPVLATGTPAGPLRSRGVSV